eukprot:7372468-Prorocentrum_lima.AAC.1
MMLPGAPSPKAPQAIQQAQLPDCPQWHAHVGERGPEHKNKTIAANMHRTPGHYTKKQLATAVT